MALIICPDCDSEVSSLAPACPKCGRPIAADQVSTTVRRPVWFGVKLGIGLFIVLPLLVVAVFVMGLMGILILPKMVGRTTEASQYKARADIEGLESALAMFKLDCGFYPSTSQGLEALVQSTSGGGPACKRYNAEGYIDRVPVDPWGNRYAFFSDGQKIIIKSYGADGKEGGDGKNADIDNGARIVRPSDPPPKIGPSAG